MGTTIIMMSQVPLDNLATDVSQIGQFLEPSFSSSPHSLHSRLNTNQFL